VQDAPTGTGRADDQAATGSAAPVVRLVTPAGRRDHHTARWFARTVGVTTDAAALTVAALLAGQRGWLAAVYALAALGTLGVTACYRPRLNLSALDGAPRVVAALGAPVLLLATLTPGSLVVRQAAVAVPLVLAARAAAAAVVRAARRGGLTERVVIVGTGSVAIELANVVTAHPEYGLSVDGFAGAPDAALPPRRHGELGELVDIVRRTGVRTVIVAFDPMRETDLVPELRRVAAQGVDVFVVPRFFELGVAPRGADVDELWGIPLHRVRQSALRPGARAVKRATDVVLGSVLLVAALPVMAVAALLVRSTGPGPILFRQRRIGQHGREFELLKFRTLPVDHVDARWNTEDAAYSHPVGRALRRLCLDELPQLWNVVRGDMSLVGPRPERTHLVEEFERRVHGYRDRHRMPAGLTGWSQVHGLRGETSLRERVRFDNQYIEHWSLWRDVVILARTLSTFFRRPNRASRPDPVLIDAALEPLARPDAAGSSDGSGSARELA
jgi:exopolysaccharide biosynthesis polyprenyl glycosylphosphotransferase